MAIHADCVWTGDPGYCDGRKPADGHMNPSSVRGNARELNTTHFGISAALDLVQHYRLSRVVLPYTYHS